MVKKNKQGFSLVELIIVIAIMAILTGLMGLGFGYLRTADSKGVAYGINSGLSDLKSRTMAKSEAVYMHLVERDGNYYLNYTDSEDALSESEGLGEKIGSSAVEVKCDGTELPAEGDVCFAIRRKDGAFTKGPEKIEVTATNGSKYIVYLVKSTGRHYVE
ncbi:MAG: prepilin-type N-terminal cleavage/methylation domain-containing protein [Lachnospiraceae bacterium]|nr:prepilin-type N-terminal cleavage/methylation domain-containing protein [Lachnospiraceae bacterium]